MSQLIEGYATAELNRYSGTDLSEEARKNLFVLSNLFVPEEHRRKGHASNLLDKLHERADRNKFAIMLIPGSFGDGKLKGRKLVNFYKRNDYVVLQKEPLLMIRYPYLNQQ
jgi:GNAT superfamily N-acetyltransferase